MSGATVLIVDDEHSLARSAKAFLADHGYETEVAGTAERRWSCSRACNRTSSSPTSGCPG
ncbi:MAG: hypothetical protein DMD36_03955 [Gemmatimonadetes bacterium]|nr:MAG: hypothetical protein DMD36_03955 [Gemmatimonadota bacterium]